MKLTGEGLMPVEFDCEGCGFHLISFVDQVPSDGFCAVCALLSEFEAPENLMPMRRRCEPGGWISERTMRAYRDRRFPERSCDHCGKPYQGPAVYCSIDCALADA